MPTDSTLFKKKMKLTRTSRATIIVAIAVSERRDENRRCEISCKEGTPIGQGVYDFVSDSYYVDCASMHHVGIVTFGYEMEIDGVESWCVSVPMPDTVFKPYLDAVDVQKLDEWRDTISRRWKVKYIQMMSVF